MKGTYKNKIVIFALSVIVPVFLMFSVIVSIIAAVIDPIENIVEFFVSAGEFIFGTDDALDNIFILSVESFLSTEEGHNYLIQVNVAVQKSIDKRSSYEPYEDEVTGEWIVPERPVIPISHILIPLLLNQEREIDQAKVDKLVAYHLTDEHKTVSLDRYIDRLRNNEPYQSIISNVSSTTVKGYIEYFVSTNVYGGVGEIGEWQYPFTSIARVTAEVGWYYLEGIRTPHYGIDLSFGAGKTCGVPIYAVSEGLVTRANKIDTGNGFVVYVHKDGKYSIRYAHLQSPSPLNEGDYIYPGQLIGFAGDTGLAYGCHLHLEIRTIPDNVVIDPRYFIDFDNPILPEPR